ncbi:MAG: hypothetical protein ACE5R4_09445 [Armatimonadota bacterium]
MNAPGRRRLSLGARLALLAAFAVAMGYLEATVVWYIRAILDWIPVPADLTPEAIEHVPSWIIFAEQCREAATIVMLVTLALLVGRTWRERLGAFLYAFAIWDIFYYVWLYVLIGWPPSLSTQDCLFLIPKPWLAPVWFPLLASGVLGMISLLLLGVGKGSQPRAPRS